MKKIFDAMGWQLLISLLISTNCFGQTTATRLTALETWKKTVDAAITKLLSISVEQDKKIALQSDSIKTFAITVKQLSATVKELQDSISKVNFISFDGNKFALLNDSTITIK